MKRVAAPILVVLALLIVSGVTFAIGRKVATDQYRGAYCDDWITGALRDAKLEGSVYKDANESYSIEFTVFLSALSDGVYFEGRNWFQTPPAGSARPAPYKICARDYSGSSTWKKYRPARLDRDSR
jgi:hypothetical protein